MRVASLVVLIVVDQMGSHYLRRWGDLATEGIGRLARRGAYYRRGIFEYANTETAAGHATIATGAWPSLHGLVANTWYDESGRAVYAVEDREYGRSPANLKAPGIADAIELATLGRGRTFSLGLKDRAAISLGGTQPDLVAWYDESAGRIVAGHWKGLPKPPGWFNQVTLSDSAASAFGRKWDRFKKGLDYERASGPDDLVTEAKLDGLGRTFPRVLGQGLTDGADARWRHVWPASPASIDALFDLARTALVKESLGRRGTIDYLAISVGTLDYAGHWWGSHSHETLDILLRIDAAIGALIDAVEKQLGDGGAIFVITADHGSLPTPEETHHLRVLRVPPEPIVSAVNDMLKREFPKDEVSVLALNSPRLYLSPTRPGVDRLHLARRAADVVRSMPGIVDAIASEDLDRWPEPLRTYYRRSSFRGRDADVLIWHEAYDLIDSVEPDGHGIGTSHGSPYGYDTTVPIIIDGPGVQGGVDERPHRMTQLAPTIAALLEIEPPAAAMDEPLPAVR